MVTWAEEAGPPAAVADAGTAGAAPGIGGGFGAITGAGAETRGGIGGKATGVLAIGAGVTTGAGARTTGAGAGRAAGTDGAVGAGALTPGFDTKGDGLCAGVGATAGRGLGAVIGIRAIGGGADT